MERKYPDSVRAWLQIILQERFGQPFTLQVQADGLLMLKLPGNTRCVTLPVNSASFARTDSNLPYTQWDAAAQGWESVLDKSIPAPGVADLPVPLVMPTTDGLHIGYDILGLTYWMLNRLEEIGRTDLDNHGRFPATSSHAYKHGYLERPIVDEWLHILGQVIQRVWPHIELKQHQFSMKVSHDVDSPSRYGFRSWKGIFRAMAGDTLKRYQFRSLWLAPWVRLNTTHSLHPADPANTFDWIMDVSEKNNLKSAFYFICGRTDASKDADYEPEHPAIRELMRRIHRRGHEIGLHPSYNTFQSPELIMGEFERLKNVCAEESIRQDEWGGRMHFLRWEQPTTLQAWSDAGLAYDSTLSYADCPGFRCGTCFEYPAFNPVTKQPLPLRIRPLIAMECTVMAERYMGFGATDAAVEKFLQLKNACRAVGGCFTTLWHNTEFDIHEKREIYECIIMS